MAVVFADRVRSTIANSGGINSSATSISLPTGDGAKWPTIPGGDVVYAVIVSGDVWEEIDVTAVSGDTLTVVRNQGGTNQSWAEGATIFAGLPARYLEEVRDNLYFEVFAIAVSDETTALTTGTGKVTFRMPYAMELTEVRASLVTASTSGAVTIDVNEGGVSIFSTALTIDQDEKTSTTAATPAVISDSSLADDAEITIDIDGAGTGAAGLKVMLIGSRVPA
tara:strand:+ start:951 stop:1619 length:669 start_codon:yes stop_codon:yes gene_type:complete